MNKAIFWDFDGTLVYANHSFEDSLVNALDSYNYQIERSIIREFLVTACSWYKPEKDYADKAMEGWWQTLLDSTEVFSNQHGVTAEDCEAICRIFRDNIIQYAYRPYEDTEEVLAYYKGLGYQNYLLSNNYPELVEVVKCFGWDKYFSDYVISSHIGYEKPRKEIFEYAKKVAGNPDICYMIGDNPIADVKGAEAVGIPAILVHRTEAAAAVERYCEQLAEIMEYITE